MARRPNVLLMIADDHRFDALHDAGNPVVQTPALDRLSEQGVTFGHAHAMGGMTGAVCIPSRACLHTGVGVFRSSRGIDVDDPAGLLALHPERQPLGVTLRAAGYRTHAIGKWHNDRLSFARGFTGGARLFFGGMSDHRQVPLHDFDPSGAYPDHARYTLDQYSSEIFADAAVAFLRSASSDEPFFLYVAFTAPHDPRAAPEPYASLYDPERMPLPENFLPEHPFDNGELLVRDEMLAPFPRTPEIVRRHLADYYAMISHLDAQIERILAALDESGHADDTIVIYTADHGLAVGQHGLLGKQNLYEHSVRVPLLLRGPALPEGKRIDALTNHQDLYPTICDLTGVPIPPSVEGRSLVPLLRGERDVHREMVFAVYKDLQRMASDGRWKLIRYYRSERGAGTATLQLFNLVDDPYETRNRAADPAARAELRRLARALTEWQQAVGDPLAGEPVLGVT